MFWSTGYIRGFRENTRIQRILFISPLTSDPKNFRNLLQAEKLRNILKNSIFAEIPLWNRGLKSSQLSAFHRVLSTNFWFTVNTSMLYTTALFLFFNEITDVWNCFQHVVTPFQKNNTHLYFSKHLLQGGKSRKILQTKAFRWNPLTHSMPRIIRFAGFL